MRSSVPAPTWCSRSGTPRRARRRPRGWRGTGQFQREPPARPRRPVLGARLRSPGSTARYDMLHRRRRPHSDAGAAHHNGSDAGWDNWAARTNGPTCSDVITDRIMTLSTSRTGSAASTLSDLDWGAPHRCRRWFAYESSRSCTDLMFAYELGAPVPSRPARHCGGSPASPAGARPTSEPHQSVQDAAIGLMNILMARAGVRDQGTGYAATIPRPAQRHLHQARARPGRARARRSQSLDDHITRPQGAGAPVGPSIDDGGPRPHPGPGHAPGRATRPRRRRWG